jgi:hypothetical protein
MTSDSMDTDVAMQVLQASKVSLGGDDYAGKNSARESFKYKIFVKIQFGSNDVMTPENIRYRFMALSDAVVTLTKGNSDSTYLTNIAGKRIDPRTSPTDPETFQAYVNWTQEDYRLQVGATIILHSAARFTVVKTSILEWLKEQRMFLSVNSTSSSIEEIFRIAVIPFLNPAITYRTGFTEELNANLQSVLNIKNEEFKSRYPCIKEDFKFDVVVSQYTERLRFKRASVATPILVVESPRSQSVLCQAILQEALTLMSPTDDGPSKYNCIPVALKNSKKYPKGPATVFRLLKEHELFLQEFKSFQIKGIHRSTMAVIRTKIMNECPAINAIEPTFMTEERGKWNVCTTILKIKEAHEWIDTHLRHLLESLDNDEKPQLLYPCVPQRIINYAEVSDDQVKHLDALSVSFIAGIPPVNAWSSPPLTATTHPGTNPSTLSASHSTILSSLVEKVDALKLQVDARDMATGHQKSSFPIQSLKPVPTPSPVSVLNGNVNLQSGMDARIEILQDDARSTKAELIAMRQILSSHATTNAQLGDRMDDFESYIDIQLAPLKEATAAGGLAALIRSCLTQPASPISIPPQTVDELDDLNDDEAMEEDEAHTPRRLFPRPPEKRSDSSSGKKRREAPSPFKASPPRGVRRDPSTPHSAASANDD